MSSNLKSAADLYLWTDRRNGVGGCRATQVLPFADPASVGSCLAFVTAGYESVTPSKAA